MVDWWLEAALYGPSIVFALLFVVSSLREPRRFRNAIWMAMFVLSLSSVLLLRFGAAQAIVPLALLMVFVPVAVVFFLSLNAVIVVRREGFSLSTLLPALLAVLLAAELVLVPYAIRSGSALWLKNIAFLVVAESLWFFFSFAALLGYSSLYRMLPRKRRYDYIVIHGAGLSGTQPTPLLKGRIDKAFALWDKQGRKALFVVSGGQGSDEEISEAEAMKRYLHHERGVDEDHILMEDQSTTTMENLCNSKRIMDERGSGYRAALVTSDYHVFRACEYARQIGLTADGVGSHTKGYYWPTAFIREFVAITKAHFWPYVAIAILWACWAVVLLLVAW